MLYVEGNVIKLTRGDTAYIEVPIKVKLDDGTETTYEIADDDVLTFSVKKTVKDSELCIQKVCTGSNIFHILPTDTEGYEFGKYLYDVQLKTAAGDVYTVVEPTLFQILQEVTC